MKILNETPKCYQVKCDKCNSKIEYEENEAHVGEQGLKFITCPKCQYEIMCENLDGVDLTKSNIQYPLHFSDYSNGANMDNDYINKTIKSGLSYLESCNSPYYIQATGNAMVIILKDDDLYKEIYVCKNYWECAVK